MLRLCRERDRNGRDGSRTHSVGRSLRYPRTDVSVTSYMTPDLTPMLQGFKVPAVCRPEKVPEPSPELSSRRGLPTG